MTVDRTQGELTVATPIETHPDPAMVGRNTVVVACPFEDHTHSHNVGPVCFEHVRHAPCTNQQYVFVPEVASSPACARPIAESS